MDTYKAMFYSLVSSIQRDLNEIKEQDNKDYKELVIKLMQIEKQLSKLKRQSNNLGVQVNLYLLPKNVAKKVNYEKELKEKR